MDAKLKQANAWGHIFAVLNADKALTAAMLDLALQNPKATFAQALRGRRIQDNPALDAALSAAIGLLDAGAECGPLDSDEQGQFFIGFYHQRAQLEATPKKAGAPLAENRVDWSTIDWGLTTKAIVQQTGVSKGTVSIQRKRYAPETVQKRPSKAQ